MNKYTLKDIEAYYNGNDIAYDIDEIENDPIFIYELIKYLIDVKKDLNEAKNYYEEYFLNIIKGDYKCVTLLIDAFKGNKDFIYKIGQNYFQTNPTNTTQNFEIAIKLADAFNNYRDQYRGMEFFTMRQALYTQEKMEIGAAINHDKQNNYGQGFCLINEEYRNNPTILTFIAENMVRDILISINLEDLLHSQFKNPDFDNKLNTFLLTFISKYDKYLADYIMPKVTKGFFDFLKHDIHLIQNNWQNYINQNNYRKKECIEKYVTQFSDVHEMAFENNGNYYNLYDIFHEIVTKYQKTELFGIEPIDPLPPNPNMTEDEKTFRNTLEHLMRESFTKDSFDPSLYAFMEFNKESKVVSIFDIDLMDGEPLPKQKKG